MRSYHRSFAGGEVTPELFGRIDDVKFQTGLAEARNFITLPHGPARLRPGTKFIAATKFGGGGTARLLEFSFSDDQTNAIELGAQNGAPGTGYLRFLTNGAHVQVTANGVPAAYKVDRAVSSITTGSPGTIVFGVNHGFAAGDRVTIFRGNVASTAPAGLVYYTRYYAVDTGNPLTLQLAAYAGGPAIPITSAGVNSQRVGVDYGPGDLVAYLGQYLHCFLNPSITGGQQDPSNATYWYPQPATGELEIPVPYQAEHIAALNYWQSNDVVSIASRLYPLRELRRYSAVNWTTLPISFSPILTTPTNVLATATFGGVAMIPTSFAVVNPLRLGFPNYVPLVNGDIVYGFVSGATGGVGPGFFRAAFVDKERFDLCNTDGSSIDATTWGAFVTGQFRAVPMSSDRINWYAVTAVDVDGNQSAASVPVSCDNNLYAEGAYNTISWNAVEGAARYRVYKLQSGIYGYIGDTEFNILTFKDDNIAGSFERTLPQFDTTLNSAPYPAAGCYHEQRRVLGRDQGIWMTRSATESDMTYSIPLRDDDAVIFDIAATRFSQIRHMVSLGSLIVLTSSTEYAVLSPDSEVITPTSVMPRPQSFTGASPVRTALVNNAVVYAAARGGHIRELVYLPGAQGFSTNDLSLRATHLFDNRSITDMAFSKAPYPIVWACSSDGRLLGMTYIPEQQVAGWHQHTFGGNVKSVISIAEGTEDSTYLIVERTVNGAVTQHIERMAPMAATAVADSFFVDAGKVFTNTAVGTLSVPHLIGKTVSILADGIVLPQQVVSSTGTITMRAAYAKVLVGLPIDGAVATLPLALQVDGAAQGQTKSIGNVWVRVFDSAPFRLGPSTSDLVPTDSTAPSVRGLLTAETLRTDRYPVRTPSAWTGDGQVFIRHTAPLPLMIVGLTIEVALGD